MILSRPVTLPLTAMLFVWFLMSPVLADEQNTSETPSGSEDNQTEVSKEIKSSETITASISVINTTTGSPVKGARVFIVPGPGNTNLERQTDVTNDNGICKIADLPSGKFFIVISAKGMKSYKKQYDINAADQINQTILVELVPEDTVISNDSAAENQSENRP